VREASSPFGTVETSVFDSLIEELHALPAGAKGRRFEELTRWYLQHAPEYRHLIEYVYAWSEWPGRWGADAGIDLVAVLHTGELWAVQAKAYAPEHSVRKSDVDSFLSESNRRDFSFRLLVATTNRIGANAARTIHQQEKAVGLTLLSQLRHALVKWPEDLNELRAAPPVRVEPYTHQLEARDDVVSGLRAGGRGQLVMACGTGKTLTGLWVDEALGSRRTLVIVPSLSLLGQTLRTWTAQANVPFSYLAVCSDETVASDSFTAWTSDLGVPVTMNSEAIRAFLVGRAERCVVFSTYHSSPVVAAAQDAGAAGFDLVIADEAHRAAGRVDAAFGTVLDAQRIRAARRLFSDSHPPIRIRAGSCRRTRARS
jgi:predicted helicase